MKFSESLKIAATYIGTIIGAGFASGQEVFQFFSIYGFNGIKGIILTSVLFFLFGYIILWLGQQLKANSYVKVIHETNGKFTGTIIDIVILLFLFGALATMIAAAGAIFVEQFQLSPFVGTILMASITLITVLTGLSGVTNSFSYLVPILIMVICFVAIYIFFTNPLEYQELEATKYINGTMPNWFFSSLSYTAFNIVMSIGILVPLGANTREHKIIIHGAFIGAVCLGLGIFAIYYSTLTTVNQSLYAEIPMIIITKQISPFIQLIFSIVLFAGVYTTAVSNLFGLATRLNSLKEEKRKWFIIVITIAAFGFSQLGFSTMVEKLYPIVGLGGVVLLFGLLYSWLFRRKQIENH